MTLRTWHRNLLGSGEGLWLHHDMADGMSNVFSRERSYVRQEARKVCCSDDDPASQELTDCEADFNLFQG